MNVGFPELVVVAVLALLVFGPERLPELARNAAKLINRFRSEASRSIEDLRSAADLGDVEEDIRTLRGELAGVREDITRGLQEPVDALRDVGKEVSSGGPTGSVPVASGPPPIDPEAT